MGLNAVVAVVLAAVEVVQVSTPVRGKRTYRCRRVGVVRAVFGQGHSGELRSEPDWTNQTEPGVE